MSDSVPETMANDYYKIELPVMLKAPKDVYVTRHSSLRERRVAFRFAGYFRRELDFDAHPFILDTGSTNLAIVRLLSEPVTVLSGRHGVYNATRFFGAVGFYPTKTQEFGFRLQWVWIHPFYRSKGQLKKIWPDLVRDFGDDFMPDLPLSKAMERFLKTHATAAQRKKFADLGLPLS